MTEPASSAHPAVARLFVATAPAPALVAQLEALHRPPSPCVRWSTADQWHVTLRFLGATPVHEIPALVEAISGLTGRGPCAAVAGPAVERLGPQFLCVPVSGLDGLAAAVSASAAGFGEVERPRTYRGHLTVARARRRHHFSAADEGAPIAHTWQVVAIDLVGSELDPAGARHTRLARIPL